MRNVWYRFPNLSSISGVAIDLKRECFKPGKKNYERTSRSLSKFKPGNFEFIIAWDPHDENICPSTIAKYFSEKGYIVRQCQPCFDYRLDSGVLIPMLQATPQTELLEWLGAFSLGVFRKYRLDPSPEAQEYLSTYEIPTSSTKSKKTVLFQCSGLFTRKKMLNIFEKLRLYASDRMEDKSWVSLTIQGFMDSPVSWSWKPHGRYRNGDNQFTIFMEKDRLLCIKVVPSNGKSK